MGFISCPSSFTYIEEKTENRVYFGRVLRLRRNTHWQGYASFDSLLSLEMAEDILGKGELLMAHPLEGLLTGLTGSSTLLEQVVSTKVWLTARH